MLCIDYGADLVILVTELLTQDKAVSRKQANLSIKPRESNQVVDDYCRPTFLPWRALRVRLEAPIRLSI